MLGLSEILCEHWSILVKNWITQKAIVYWDFSYLPSFSDLSNQTYAHIDCIFFHYYKRKFLDQLCTIWKKLSILLLEILVL